MSIPVLFPALGTVSPVLVHAARFFTRSKAILWDGCAKNGAWNSYPGRKPPFVSKSA